MFTLLNKFFIIAAICASVVFLGVVFLGDEEAFFDHDRINGVNLVATNEPLTPDQLSDLSAIEANWVAIVPYAFSRKNQPGVTFDHHRQWYGERTQGAMEAISIAKDFGYRVMIKPHVWVQGDGWPGEYTLSSEEEWQQWEEAYETYILTYAAMADSMDVDLLCIGTEYRVAVKERMPFWKNLISKVRKTYKGKLTYAANWDNYENIEFWEDLDFIGIDAYFPLMEAKRPEVEDLIEAWEPHESRIVDFSNRFAKPVLFTEYGYRSVEFCTKGPWEKADDRPSDMIAQKHAYEALYRTFWNEPWFAGGFLWKWFPDHPASGGVGDRKFTPQNKHAQQVIARWYGRRYN